MSKTLGIVTGLQPVGAWAAVPPGVVWLPAGTSSGWPSSGGAGWSGAGAAAWLRTSQPADSVWARGGAAAAAAGNATSNTAKGARALLTQPSR